MGESPAFCVRDKMFYKTGTLRLSRQEDHETEGVFSVLKLNGEIFCVGLEPPERGNARKVSCIPTGQYTLKRYNSTRYPDTWVITNVPRRDKVLIHSGNVVENTEGCLLIAEKFGKLKGDRAILNSGNTFKSFMSQTREYDALHLTITEDY